MPTDDRPKLKRFQHLDIDGVTRPPKPARRRAPEPAKTAPAPAPVSRTLPAPPARQPLVARPMPAPSRPAPASPSQMREQLRLTMGRSPGVVTIETAAPAHVERRQVRTRVLQASPHRDAPIAPQAAVRRPDIAATVPSPVSLTPIAARQLRLMAYQSGMAGAALRILVSHAGAERELDFAFETMPGQDDVVCLSEGVHLVIDARDLEDLRGLRITYQDLPGASGFGAI